MEIGRPFLGLLIVSIPEYLKLLYIILKHNGAEVQSMVELRCNNCKRVFQYSGDERFYTNCPQCNAQVLRANPINYGRNNPDVLR